MLFVFWVILCPAIWSRAKTSLWTTRDWWAASRPCSCATRIRRWIRWRRARRSIGTHSNDRIWASSPTMKSNVRIAGDRRGGGWVRECRFVVERPTTILQSGLSSKREGERLDLRFKGFKIWKRIRPISAWKHTENLVQLRDTFPILLTCFERRWLFSISSLSFSMSFFKNGCFSGVQNGFGTV